MITADSGKCENLAGQPRRHELGADIEIGSFDDAR